MLQQEAAICKKEWDVKGSTDAVAKAMTRQQCIVPMFAVALTC